MADILQVLDLPVELERGVFHVLHDSLELVLAVRVKILRELLFPRRGLRLERHLERLGLQGQRADVVHGRDFADVLLNAHVLLKLSLKHIQVGLLRHELLVRLLEILEVEEIELGECCEVLLHAGAAAVHGASEQEAKLDHVDVAGDFVEKRTRAEVIVVDAGLILLVTVEIGVAPPLDGPRCVEHLLSDAVHRALHVVQARRHLDVRDRELDVHVKERPLDEQETARNLGRDPLLEHVEGFAGGVQHRGVHESGEVRLEFRDGLVVDGGKRHQAARLRLRHRVPDQLHEIVASPANLLGLDRQDIRGLLDVLGLDRGELLQRDELVLGQVHHYDPSRVLEVIVYAVVEHVVNLGNDQFQVVDRPVNAFEVHVDVGGRPSQVGHARCDDHLELGEVSLEERAGHGRDLVVQVNVHVDGVGELVVVGLELVLLRQHDARGLGHFHVHPHHELGLADELTDLAVKVDEKLAGVGVAHQERRAKANLAVLDTLDPSLVPKSLVGHERGGDPVVQFNHPFGLLHRHDALHAGEVPHGTLDPAEKLPGPENVTRNRRRVPGQRRRVLLLLVKLLDALKIIRVVPEYLDVLVVQIILQRVAAHHRGELAEEGQRRFRG